MKKKKQKGFWVKRKEVFATGTEARARAAMLRDQEHVSHVTTGKKGNSYEVSYSIAAFFVEEMKKAGIDL